jgi:hypothetical protein
MNKKILIGVCILATTIMILTGLSPVIGFQRIKTIGATGSPLFQVRTSRAINDDTMKITGEYVRQGELMPFPLNNLRDSPYLKTIDSIGDMNDEEIHRITDQLLSYIQMKDEFNDIDEDDLLNLLFEMRRNPDLMKYNLGGNGEDYSDYSYGIYRCTSDNIWIPGCRMLALMIYMFWELARVVVELIYIIIFGGIPSSIAWCTAGCI